MNCTFAHLTGWRTPTVALLVLVALSSCALNTDNTLASLGPNPALPAPEYSMLPTVNVATAMPWLPGQQPTPAIGLQVTRFVDGLDHPRWLLALELLGKQRRQSRAAAKTRQSD